MINLPRMVLGLVLSTLIGWAAWRRGSLTLSGWLGAVITGTLTFGAGGWTWGFALVAFFVSSSLLSHYKEQIKAQRTGETFAKGGQRDLGQALANGGLGSLLALAYALSGEPPLLLALFVGVMATVTADTWATELGVLSPHQPRLITTLRPVQPGISGGITLTGVGASAAGGVFIGATMWCFSALMATIQADSALPVALLWLFPAALAGGVLGSLTDSFIGATRQAIYCTPDGHETERAVGKDGTPHRLTRGWRWLTNDMVNMASSAVGGVVAGAVFMLAEQL